MFQHAGCDVWRPGVTKHADRPPSRPKGAPPRRFARGLKIATGTPRRGRRGPRPGADPIQTARHGAARATPGLGEGDLATTLAPPWGRQPCIGSVCRLGAACSPWLAARPAAGSTGANVYATRRAGRFFTYAKSTISAAGVMPSRRAAWANVAGRTFSSRWRTSAERPAILA